MRCLDDTATCPNWQLTSLIATSFVFFVRPLATSSFLAFVVPTVHLCSIFLAVSCSCIGDQPSCALKSLQGGKKGQFHEFPKRYFYIRNDSDTLVAAVRIRTGAARLNHAWPSPFERLDGSASVSAEVSGLASRDTNELERRHQRSWLGVFSSGGL